MRRPILITNLTLSALLLYLAVAYQELWQGVVGVLLAICCVGQLGAKPPHVTMDDEPAEPESAPQEPAPQKSKQRRRRDGNTTDSGPDFDDDDIGDLIVGLGSSSCSSSSPDVGSDSSGDSGGDSGSCSDTSSGSDDCGGDSSWD